MNRLKRILDLEKTGLFNWKKGKTGQTKDYFLKNRTAQWTGEEHQSQIVKNEKQRKS